jgi:2-C-methyl-D-erythritol 4-phosphate cytidylyltransferase
MIGAIILAGGKGHRFGGQKQFVELDGIPLWQIVYNKVKKFVNENNIVVVGIDVPGGDTRSLSVINGLKRLNSDVTRVLILESARPLVTLEQIEMLLTSSYESVTFVKPLVNTVVFRDGTYVDRETMYELLTPQCFDRNLLQKAYENTRDYGLTDETRLMNFYYGIKPKFFLGSDNLFKITYPKDIHIIMQIKNDIKEK